MTQLVQLEGKHTDCTKSILCIVLMSSTLLYPSRCWFSQIRESHLKNNLQNEANVKSFTLKLLSTLLVEVNIRIWRSVELSWD